jgi:hypothetical protein
MERLDVQLPLRLHPHTDQHRTRREHLFQQLRAAGRIDPPTDHPTAMSTDTAAGLSNSRRLRPDQLNALKQSRL